MQVLRIEGFERYVLDEEGRHQDAAEANEDDVAQELASEKRTELGIYLTMQRRQQG